MEGFELLPAIDLRGGRVVRLLRGDFAAETAYDDDPVRVARAFVEGGAGWLHLVDLDAARDPTAGQRGLVRTVVAAVGREARVEVAGGLRDLAAAEAMLAAGAARVVVGTAALARPGFAGELVRAFGVECVAAALDVREGKAVGHGWRAGAPGLDALTAARRLADAGVETFEVTAIERDGTLEGPDLVVLRELAGVAERSRIIASGGIGSVSDIAAVREAGCVGAIVGRALYEGRLSLREALTAAG